MLARGAEIGIHGLCVWWLSPAVTMAKKNPPLRVCVVANEASAASHGSSAMSEYKRRKGKKKRQFMETLRPELNVNNDSSVVIRPGSKQRD